MYTLAIQTLRLAIPHARVVATGTCAARATAATQQFHALPVLPVLITVLAVGFLMLVIRINFALLGWAAHLAELTAAIGRTLVVIALAAGLIAIVLLHL
jgi:hypothetical protein